MREGQLQSRLRIQGMLELCQRWASGKVLGHCPGNGDIPEAARAPRDAQGGVEALGLDRSLWIPARDIL